MLRAALALSAGRVGRWMLSRVILQLHPQHSRIAGFSFCSLRKTKALATDNKYIKLISALQYSTLQITANFNTLELGRYGRAMQFTTQSMAWWEFPERCKNSGYHLRKMVKFQAFSALFLTRNISSPAQENMSYRL